MCRRRARPGGVPARTQNQRLGRGTPKSASVGALTPTGRKKLRKEGFERQALVSHKWSMGGTRPDYSSHAPFTLPLAPLRGGRLVGGQKRTWVRPLGVCSLTHACAEGQEGREAAQRPGATRPDNPLPLVSMGARRQPRSPASGPRLKVRAQHPGKVGRGARRCARSHPPGEGGTGKPPPSCLPLLTCVLGGVLTTPPPAEEGGGPPLGRRLHRFKSP